MTSFLGAIEFQLQLVRAERDYLLDLAVTPLLSVGFLALVHHAGREDLVASAILAPVLMALWAMAVHVSGEIIDYDRWQGTLESVLASPSSLSGIVLGRSLSVALLSLISLPESLLVATLGFGVQLNVHHPMVFLCALVAASVASAATSVAMAGVFVLARSARMFQNSLTYPLFLLGGVIVPPELLPEWLRPFSRLVFLSWTSDLLRDSVSAAPVRHAALRLGAVLLLGALGLAIGRSLTGAVLGRVRSSGSLAYR